MTAKNDVITKNKRAIPRISHKSSGIVTLSTGRKIVCIVVDISIKGIGFTSFGDHLFAIGEEMTVQFNGPLFLDPITKKCRIVAITGNRIGAEIIT